MHYFAAFRARDKCHLKIQQWGGGNRLRFPATKTIFQNINSLITIISCNWFPPSFVIQTSWWDFLLSFLRFKHKYDNFILKGIVFILEVAILCRILPRVCDYIHSDLRFSFDSLFCVKQIFMILKIPLYALNASAFSVISSLSTSMKRWRVEEGRSEEYLCLESSNIHHTWNLFNVLSLGEMKSKFFIKYLTSRWNVFSLALALSSKLLPMPTYCVRKIELSKCKGKNHNRTNSFMLTSPFSPLNFPSSSWKNEEAKKSHKISGKNNFLRSDINDDDAWLNVYVIVNTKWSIKICSCVKSTVFIRFHSWRQRVKERKKSNFEGDRIIEWCIELARQFLLWFSLRKPAAFDVSFHIESWLL